MNGYTETQSHKEQRAIRMMGGYAVNLYLRTTSENDADRIHDLIVASDYMQRVSEQSKQEAESADIAEWLDEPVSISGGEIMTRGESMWITDPTGNDAIPF